MALKLLNAFNFSQRSANWVFSNFTFLLFVAFLGIVYIANAHFAEKSVRNIQSLQKEIKELKWEYTSIKSETMYKSMQSQISPDLGETGLVLPAEGPRVIRVK